MEICFGILVSKWEVFRKPNHAGKGNVLHNYLRQAENASCFPRGFVNSETNGDFHLGQWESVVRDGVECFMSFGRCHAEYTKRS